MTREVVENNIDRSLHRMGVETLDLLQFHWWDYQDSRYLDALTHLAELRDEGKIHRVALTNFDTERLRIIGDHGIRWYPIRCSIRSSTGGRSADVATL